MSFFPYYFRALVKFPLNHHKPGSTISSVLLYILSSQRDWHSLYSYVCDVNDQITFFKGVISKRRNEIRVDQFERQKSKCAFFILKH